jgi:hypothetical protein
MNLSGFTDEQIKAELDRRALERAIVRQHKTELIVGQIDFFNLVLTHDRGSCHDSDSSFNGSFHPVHGVAECNLCVLRELADGNIDPKKVVVEISVTCRRIEK